uniref:IAA-amino acid hydrolase ILR1-like n=1 Tax=Tanacetum cinerariifolium TaxID=118510 RepID=A0A6L2MVE3_TANCI|nr:IAA-amino acid hydrolase ILR1-like [Tanacetum cinerariifolium]
MAETRVVRKHVHIRTVIDPQIELKPQELFSINEDGLSSFLPRLFHTIIHTLDLLGPLGKQLLSDAKSAEFYKWMVNIRRRMHDNLGAAKLLQAKRHELKGTIKLVFQPGEEGFAGAYHMLKHNTLDNIKAAFALHVLPQYPVGVVASRSGAVLAGSGMFTATIKGIGGHAATPHLSKDPILAASMAIVALQQIVSRETDPLESRVVTIGHIIGGQADNVIPESVQFGGTYRSLSPQGLVDTKARIKEVFEMQAAVHQCNAELDFKEETPLPFPVVENDEEMYEHAKMVAEMMLGKPNVRLLPVTMGGSQNKTNVIPEYLHSPYFVIDEEALPVGAAFHAAVAISYLDSHGGVAASANHDELAQGTVADGLSHRRNHEPEMFGDDAIPRPFGAPRKSKSQRSSASSSATSGSSKNRLTEFFQDQIQLDREAKKESLDRELAARLAIVELQKRNEDLKILTFDTTGMNLDDAAKIEALKAKTRTTYFNF